MTKYIVTQHSGIYHNIAAIEEHNTAPNNTERYEFIEINNTDNTVITLISHNLGNCRLWKDANDSVFYDDNTLFFKYDKTTKTLKQKKLTKKEKADIKAIIPTLK